MSKKIGTKISCRSVQIRKTKEKNINCKTVCLNANVINFNFTVEVHHLSDTSPFTTISSQFSVINFPSKGFSLYNFSLITCFFQSCKFNHAFCTDRTICTKDDLFILYNGVSVCSLKILFRHYNFFTVNLSMLPFTSKFIHNYLKNSTMLHSWLITSMCLHSSVCISEW